MLYKRQHLFLFAILLSTGAHFTPISYENIRMTAGDLVRRVRKIDPMKMNQEFLRNVDFSKMFKELHQYLSPEEVRMVTTLGLVTGALSAEESMREHLYILTDNLLETFNLKRPKESMEKLIVIEQTIIRDESVVNVLNGMLRYARNETTLDALQTEFLNILSEVKKRYKTNFSRFFFIIYRFYNRMRMH